MIGLVDTSSQPALGYMEIVQQRDAATLLPIIQAHVAPGTIVHSDQWAAYNQVATLPNVGGHSTVNHSVTFVDPTTGTHTQNVESYWNRAKMKLKRMRGCHATQLPGYLDEFMWRERGSTDISGHVLYSCTTRENNNIRAKYFNFAGQRSFMIQNFGGKKVGKCPSWY